MKQLSRALLKLLTLGIPVVIAACYGPAYRYGKDGKVIDKESHQGIEGIRVSCVLPDGTEEGAALSSTDGSFYLEYDLTCATLKAEDVDGETNGKYKPAELPFSEESGTVTVMMEKEL